MTAENPRAAAATGRAKAAPADDLKRRNAELVPGGLPELPHGTAAYVTEPLPCHGRAARLARCQVAYWCDVLRVPGEAVAELALIVSELVTNGHVHGRGPLCLRLAILSSTALVVDVYDGAPITPGLSDGLGGPEPADPDDDGGVPHTGGRGLRLVRALADEVELMPHPLAGKTVRVRFTVPGD